MTPWESGSFFPLTAGASSNALGGICFGSGRQALMALVSQRRWHTVHLPTYYCPEVVADLRSIVDVRRYAASPAGDLDEPNAGAHDAVVAVSYFGQPPRLPEHRGRALIVDASHDPIAPWLATIGADYVFASLRKTLPLPDGGLLWSPAGHDIAAPGPPTDRHLVAVGHMLAAMALKAAYLADSLVDKRVYLELAGLADDGFRRCVPGAMSAYSRAALATFPLVQWRAQRLAAIAALATELARLPVEVLPSTFGIVLRCADGHGRDALRSGLIARGVYPAVLWDLTGEPVPERHRELAGQLLFVHADHRTSPADVHRIAEAVAAGRPAERSVTC